MRTEYLCTEPDEGRKVYGILRRELALSLAQVRRLKPAGGIFVNGEPAHTDVRVKPGDRVSIRLPALEREALLQPQDGPLEILYESAGALIVNKPRGILVHPTHAQILDTLANYALFHVRETDPEAACHAVNRLDRDTGGAVLFAKSARMKRLLAAALAQEDCRKEYVALLFGTPSPAAGVIELPLKRESMETMRRVPSPEGQRAVTEYAVLARGDGYSLVRFRLRTGRTHQIRAHCLALGHPVLGDKLYRTPESEALSRSLGLEGQALHAFRLVFSEPVSGEAADVFAPLRSQPMAALAEVLGWPEAFAHGSRA